LIVGKLADAIYEGRHGQVDEVDYESADDFEDEVLEDIPDEEIAAVLDVVEGDEVEV
ncbi:MAG: 30S ribosomal protein S2, partial [Pseudanabaena sp. RU_4_16]|nr:30S ribosomal protein S2 [Pseudanabaena sp. RU_4_16]